MTHANCLSGFCKAGFCATPSCADGVKNQNETDVDCGGPCAGCGVGKACAKASDCTSNACEGGSCCSPNACGQCTTTPQEICDGKDNDCDGQTDEASQIGTPPACAKQQGVCAGAWSACKGAAGWQCDDAVYKLHSSAYEGSETTCDGKDNDCDGQTDEGTITLTPDGTPVVAGQDSEGLVIWQLDGDTWKRTASLGWDDGGQGDPSVAVDAHGRYHVTLTRMGYSPPLYGFYYVMLCPDLGP